MLLSHDHHFDNLDRAGRALLPHAEVVLTTPTGAERLGPPAVGLAPWQAVELPTRDGRRLRVTGTPGRHGPANGDRGAVIVPLHYEGWAHFSEGRAEIERAFGAAGIATRLRWLPPGQPTALALEG